MRFSKKYKRIAIQKLLAISVVCVLFTACSNGVSLEEFNSIEASYNQIQSDYVTLEKNNQALQDEYRKKMSETSELMSKLKKYENITSVEDEIEDLNNTKLENEAVINELLVKKDALTEDVSLLESEIRILSSKKRETTSTVTLGQGQYIVGEDIDSGKYDISVISGSGNFQGNIDSLGGYDYSLNEILAEEGDSFWDEGYSTYSNLRLKNGDSFTISGGMKLKFDKLD